jgi:outer membrane lipoprotein-sorting protein
VIGKPPAWCVAAALVAALPWRAPAQSGGDPGIPVVRRASQAYQSLSSFQATFHQHFEDKAVDQPDSKGILYQQGTNLFAMRFTDPPKDAIVADGTRLWVYTPSETPGQVLQYPLQNHPTYGTNLLGTFLDNAAERYRITYLRSEMIDGHMTDVVIMEPLETDLPFRRATIWFDRDNHMPRKLDIEESHDRNRILQLSQLQLNRPIDPSMFRCKTPLGTRIVN